MVLVWICNEALMKYIHKKVFHLLSKGYWYAGWINWRRNSSLLHALIIDIKVHSEWMSSYRFKCLMKCLFSIFFSVCSAMHLMCGRFCVVCNICIRWTRMHSSPFNSELFIYFLQFHRNEHKFYFYFQAISFFGKFSVQLYLFQPEVWIKEVHTKKNGLHIVKLLLYSSSKVTEYSNFTIAYSSTYKYYGASMNSEFERYKYIYIYKFKYI